MSELKIKRGVSVQDGLALIMDVRQHLIIYTTNRVLIFFFLVHEENKGEKKGAKFKSAH